MYMDQQDEQLTNPSPSKTPNNGVLPLPHDGDVVDDVEIESYSDDTLDGSVTMEERLKKLRERMNVLSKERKEYLDGWQRAKADFANYKRRESEEKEGFLKYAREGLVSDLTPVLESFDMAFAGKEAWEKVDPAWRKGVEYIHSQLLQILHENGLELFEPKVGDHFDPNLHTSVGTVETSDNAKDGTIANVSAKGYRLSGKVIRSPRVQIYKATE